MKKQIIAMLAAGAMLMPQLCTVRAAADEEDFSNLLVKYSSPAAVKGSSGGWTYGGTPIGNGKLGAKIYGGVDKDVYQLNDASFWSGGPQYTDLYDETGARREALENTRALLQGDLKDWENISAIEASAKQMVGSSLAASYLPVGDLILDFGGDNSYGDYSRVLDLDSATVTTKYKKDGVSYTRTAFASYPDNVIAVKLEADGGTIDMTAALSFPEEKEAGAGSEYRGVNDNNEYVMSWRAPVSADKMIWADDYGMTVEARIRITETDGNVSCSDEGITLSGARMPDKAAMWVRLGEPDKALEIMKTTNESMIAQWGADVQNAFAEFMVQSHRGYIDLLPALPSSWQNGEIKGTRVRGGYELDIKWSGGELESCVIYSKAGGGFPDIRLEGEMLSETDPRITFVDAQAPEQEAENLTANTGEIRVADDTASMDYTVSSLDANTATRICTALAVYDMSGGEPVLADMVYKNVKLYNTQSYSGTLRYDCSDYVGNGKQYMFKGFVWRASDMEPLCTASVSDSYEFKVREVYNSAADFNGEQGPVWYFRSEDGNLNFGELESYDSSGGYWQGAYTYLRVGGSFMHPEKLNAVRTFKAPADGTITIKSSTVKADDSKGSTDGVFIKIVKETGSGTEQLYPAQGGYAQITNAQHLSGFAVPEIVTEVSAGDKINFILNQGDGNAHDGTRWTNEIEYSPE